MLDARCESRAGTVWVFHGESSKFASGVFEYLSVAEEWIARHGLSGILTRYPVDTGVYEWAIEGGFFRPKKDEHSSAAFVQRFTSASQEHYHYERGHCSERLGGG